MREFYIDEMPLSNAALTEAFAKLSHHMQVRLNAWNQPFYDALTHKDGPEFLRQLGIFAVLAAILLTLNVAQVWLNQTTRLTLRKSLVHDMLNQWLKPLRAFRLSNAGSIGANPDQRMSADAQHLADLVTDLLIGLLQSTLLLLSFIGVLWFLSQQMVLPWRGAHIQVPGYLVWCALLYAAVASFLSWRIGRPLVALNAERYAPREARRVDWATISHSTVVHHAPAERRPIPTEPMGMADRAAERLPSECDRKCIRERARPVLRSQARDQAAWRVANETRRSL